MKAYNGKQPYVFISYSHKDSGAAELMELLAERGYRIWYDDGIEYGDEWPENIETHLLGCDVFVALLSESFVASVNCRNEINYALLQKKPILLIYLAPTQLRHGMGLQLSAVQSVMYYSMSREDFARRIDGTSLLAACRDNAARNGAAQRTDAKKNTASGQKDGHPTDNDDLTEKILESLDRVSYLRAKNNAWMRKHTASRPSPEKETAKKDEAPVPVLEPRFVTAHSSGWKPVTDDPTLPYEKKHSYEDTTFYERYYLAPGIPGTAPNGAAYVKYDRHWFSEKKQQSWSYFDANRDPVMISSGFHTCIYEALFGQDHKPNGCILRFLDLHGDPVDRAEGYASVSRSLEGNSLLTVYRDKDGRPVDTVHGYASRLSDLEAKKHTFYSAAGEKLTPADEKAAAFCEDWPYDDGKPQMVYSGTDGNELDDRTIPFVR